MLFMVRPDVKSIHRLADLLETIGVTADEMLEQKLPARDLAAIRAMSDAQLQDQLGELRQFIGRVRGLELAVIAKLTQAREKSRIAARTDWRLRPILMLFTAGTQGFADRFQAEANQPDRGFDGDGRGFGYLKSRGLLGEAAVSYDGSAELQVTDSFRLMGVLQLRDLLERCEATLNALDAHYDLYEIAEDGTEDMVETSSDTPAATESTAKPQGEAVNWGTDVAAAASAVAIEEQAAEAAAIAAAQAEVEAGLKSLAERLADLKEEPLAAAPAKASSAA